jgi:hypothetical protein
MEGPNIDHHTHIQGQDTGADGWSFQGYLDVTDAWTQLACIVVVLFSYGILLVYYMHTKKFNKTKHGKSNRHSKAWKAWDKTTVNFNRPHITRHNDFLGWEKCDNREEFEGHIYLYCMPTSGPCRDHANYVKKKMVPGLKFTRVPFRAFFFDSRRYLDADRLDDVPKKYPFTELEECLKDVDLYKTVPSFAVSLPQTENGLTIKVTTTFEIDLELKEKLEEMFERCRTDLAEIDGTNPQKKKIILESKIIHNVSA